eukprot:Skav218088  [mRNA]  locus=scaffold1801:28544:29056:- [translate_table: standard]
MCRTCRPWYTMVHIKWSIAGRNDNRDMFSAQAMSKNSWASMASLPFSWRPFKISHGSNMLCVWVFAIFGTLKRIGVVGNRTEHRSVNISTLVAILFSFLMLSGAKIGFDADGKLLGETHHLPRRDFIDHVAWPHATLCESNRLQEEIVEPADATVLAVDAEDTVAPNSPS